MTTKTISASTGTAVAPAPLAITTNPATALTTSVEGLNSGLATYLEHHDLPTANILVPLKERRTVIDSLANAIDDLAKVDREKAYYLSKFVVAVTIGLFDAALNYLWNETILALRQTVAKVDLAYFFDVAEKRQDYRKRLATIDDLPRIEDNALIDACGRIGILTPVNAERLRHINYMRNHASAAHPNSNDLNGAEMVGWLTNCLRYAITATPDPAVLQMQQFLVTVRERVIATTDAPVYIGDLRKMDQARLDDLILDPVRHLRRPQHDAAGA